jgi:MFS family permease
MILGWIIGIPVPFLIIFANSWAWIVVANLFLGANQGLCWSTAILMMMDLMSSRKGLSTGFNEFVGYTGVSLATFSTGIIASVYGPRPFPFFIGVILSFSGFLISLFFLKDTVFFVKMEEEETNTFPSYTVTTAFKTSIQDRTLISCNMNGMITKINDATVWGIFPLYFASKGMSVEMIGSLVALYPMVWGIAQFGTGALSDYIGRKPLLVLGMFGQALGMLLVLLGRGHLYWSIGVFSLGLSTAMVYPTLIAAIGDRAHPAIRASEIGIYRFWRDGGFIVGAFISGLLVDLSGFGWAIGVIAGLNVLSGMTTYNFMEREIYQAYLHPSSG